MNQVFVFVFAAVCVLATVSAFPASIEDEANYLRTARQIIQGRVNRSPQYGYYNNVQTGYGYNQNGGGYGYGYPSHAGRRMDYGYNNHYNYNMGANNGFHHPNQMGHGHYHG